MKIFFLIDEFNRPLKVWIPDELLGECWEAQKCLRKVSWVGRFEITAPCKELNDKGLNDKVFAEKTSMDLEICKDTVSVCSYGFGGTEYFIDNIFELPDVYCTKTFMDKLPKFIMSLHEGDLQLIELHHLKLGNMIEY